MMWVKLEPIIQSEVSYKEKQKYSVLVHRFGIQKGVIDNPPSKATRDTDVKNRLLDSVGEGEGGMI